LNFVRWSQREQADAIYPDPEELKTIRKAKTSAEIQAVLAKHDDNGLFMYMVREGEL
jgi:hypothetical protein